MQSCRRRFSATAVTLLALASTACSGPGHAGVAGTTNPLTSSPAVAATSVTSVANAPDSKTVLANSIVVLGHSGATGFGSDATDFMRDAYENSWATGTNPEVNSVYVRLLAQNPAIKGHNFNFAKDGSRVDDLVRQANMALKLSPPVDLVLIQTIDNDIRCDRTDAQNYAPFGAALLRALTLLHAGAPHARLFLVSQWGSVERDVAIGQQLPFSVAYASGSGPCDVYDKDGQIRPDQVKYLQDVVNHYHAELHTSCSVVPQCSTDKGAMQQLDLGVGDLVSDGNHLSISGHRKMAAMAWAALH